MVKRCAECGAVLANEDSCQAIFDALLVLEFSNPAYGEVHFLTVACFMIQHGRYSDEGLAWIGKTLRRYLEEGLTGEEVQRIAAEDTGSDQRRWKVTRAPDAPPPPKSGLEDDHPGCGGGVRGRGQLPAAGNPMGQADPGANDGGLNPAGW